MDPMVELAGATAAALVEAIVKKDNWISAKQAVVALWSRHGAKKVEFVDANLADTEAQLASAGTGLADVQAELTGTWTNNLKALLRERPEAADELRQVLALLTPPDADPGAPKPDKLIQQTGTASGGGIVNQIGEFIGGSGAVTFTIGTGVPPQSPPPAVEA